MFFQLLSTIEVSLVAKIMRSALLCVTFHVKRHLLDMKKVQFAHFSTKQVCNVKTKNFQCLINVNSSFLI